MQQIFMVNTNYLKKIFSNIKMTLSCGRFNQWPKNIFMLPGFFLALTLEDKIAFSFFFDLFYALIAVGFLSSANYTLNEIFDRKSDTHHPLKKNRTLVKNKLPLIYPSIQCFIFIVIGLYISLSFNPIFFLTSILFIMMALIYNIPPIRLKEIPYLDVLTEAINNPIRLILGWSIISPIIIPPLSLLISFWFCGCFLMSMKRLAEYNYIDNKNLSSSYRSSFRHYNEINLILFSFFCSLVAIFFLAIFTLKYFIQLILIFPFICILFIWYTNFALRVKFDKNNYKNIFLNFKFLVFCFFVGISIIVLFFFDFKFLDFFVNHTFHHDLKLNWN